VIPLGPAINAGAAADVFDVLMMTVTLGTVALGLLVNAAVAIGWLRRRR
jgi:hypothetical protein